VELFRKKYKGKIDERADKYLDFIVQATDRMKVLIKDLLDYSRIGRKTELQKVDCNIILSEVLADLNKAIKDVHAEIISDQLPVIKGYPTELKQLFQNLISNALKFRKIDVNPLINISAEKNNEHWTFSFKDNGIGIEERYYEKIFIIFQRLHTRNEFEGSGIGLSHCKKIVELHGGKIWVESRIGEGSTFYFTIPEN
jgi:light-regulated signal transduction histidine kinase (bacteriophytochrome)